MKYDIKYIANNETKEEKDVTTHYIQLLLYSGEINYMEIKKK